MKEIKINTISIGQTHPLVLIAGPCVIESEEIVFRIAHKLKEMTSRIGIQWILKTSFDKANRSNVDSYRGPGLEKGLTILERIRSEFEIAVLSDVHTPDQVSAAAQVLDIIQIPAFLCRQTDLLIAAGKTGKPVNIKKGQFMAPEDMIQCARKVESVDNKKIMITERGTSLGYHNLVVDMRSLKIIRDLGYPVIFDATHSVQLPAANGIASGGERKYIPSLAKAAVAAGIDGIFMEVHFDPENALCDAACMWPLNILEQLLEQLKEIDNTVRSHKDIDILDN
jgi:2-dehydro-3-deoxyphosphooctonate aldolase (KDO 8-P synthase)